MFTLSLFAHAPHEYPLPPASVARTSSGAPPSLANTLSLAQTPHQAMLLPSSSVTARSHEHPLLPASVGRTSSTAPLLLGNTLSLAPGRHQAMLLPSSSMAARSLEYLLRPASVGRTYSTAPLLLGNTLSLAQSPVQAMLLPFSSMAARSHEYLLRPASVARTLSTVPPSLENMLSLAQAPHQATLLPFSSALTARSHEHPLHAAAVARTPSGAPPSSDNILSLAETPHQAMLLPSSLAVTARSHEHLLRPASLVRTLFTAPPSLDNTFSSALKPHQAMLLPSSFAHPWRLLAMLASVSAGLARSTRQTHRALSVLLDRIPSMAPLHALLVLQGRLRPVTAPPFVQPVLLAHSAQMVQLAAAHASSDLLAPPGRPCALQPAQLGLTPTALEPACCAPGAVSPRMPARGAACCALLGPSTHWMAPRIQRTAHCVLRGHTIKLRVHQATQAARYALPARTIRALAQRVLRRVSQQHLHLPCRAISGASSTVVPQAARCVLQEHSIPWSGRATAHLVQREHTVRFLELRLQQIACRAPQARRTRALAQQGLRAVLRVLPVPSTQPKAWTSALHARQGRQTHWQVPETFQTAHRAPVETFPARVKPRARRAPAAPPSAGSHAYRAFQGHTLHCLWRTAHRAHAAHTIRTVARRAMPAVCHVPPAPGAVVARRPAPIAKRAHSTRFLGKGSALPVLLARTIQTPARQAT